MNRKCFCVFLAAILTLPACYRATAQAEQGGALGSAPPIKLGAIFSLSSFGASWGLAEKQATELAVEEINKAGGVMGRPLQLVVEDNNSDLKKSAAAFKKLAELDHVAAILGPNWVEFVEVTAPLANNAKLVTISASGYKDSIFKDGSFLFSAWPAHDSSLEKFAAYLARQGHKKLALLTSNNAYYHEISDSIVKLLKAKGVVLDRQEFFNPDERDYRSTVLALKKNGIDGVVLALMLDGSLSAFLQQARALGYQPALYADNDFALDSVLKANPALGEGVVFFNWTPEDGAPFTKRYTERFDTPPVVSSAAAYDNVYAVKKALEFCGGEPGPRLRECLLQVQFNGEFGPIAYNNNGTIKSSQIRAKIFKSTGKAIVEIE